MELTRRNFVAGAAALGGSAALASATLTASQACANEAAALPEGTTAEDFANSLVPVEPIADFVDEKSYDVVVVGAGTAGVPAVWGALEEGATVACLQKEVAPMANGNGSSGLILEESNEIGKLQYKQNWRKAGGYRMNPDLLDLWVEHSGETAMWIDRQGPRAGSAARELQGHAQRVRRGLLRHRGHELVQPQAHQPYRHHGEAGRRRRGRGRRVLL